MLAQLYYLFPVIQKCKESVNQPRYGRLYNCKYSQILIFHNGWIIMSCFDDLTYEDYYQQINQTILDGNVMKTSLIIIAGKFGAVDYYDY